MDVRMPDGTILRGVPDDLSKDDILDRYRNYLSRQADQAVYNESSIPEKVQLGLRQSATELGHGVDALTQGGSNYYRSQLPEQARTGEVQSPGELAGIDALTVTDKDKAELQRLQGIEGGWKTTGKVLGDIGMMAIPGAAGARSAAGLPRAVAASRALGGESLGAGVVEGLQSQDPFRGAVAGASTMGLGHAVPRLLGLNRSVAAQELADQGVGLTPGQRWGGIAKFAEELLSYIPGTAKSVIAAKERALSSWNGVVGSIATNVRGLSPHKAIEATKAAVKSGYDEIFKGSAKLDDGLFPKWANILEDARGSMAPKEYKQLEKLFANLADPIAKGRGSLAGNALQTLDQRLGKLMTQAYRRGDSIAGDTYKSAKEVLRQSMPEDMASSLARNNELYGKFKTLESATAKVAPSKRQPPGTFTPEELLSSSAAGRRPQAATGRAPLQGEASTAAQVLTPPNVAQGAAAVVPALAKPFLNPVTQKAFTSNTTADIARLLSSTAPATSEEYQQWMADLLRQRR
jgi:hypothetical protein